MLNILSSVAMGVATALLVSSGIRACQVRNRFLKMGRSGACGRAGRPRVVRRRGRARRDGQAACLQRSGSRPQGRGNPRTNGARQGARRWLLQRLSFENRHAHRRCIDVGEDFPIPIGSFVSSNLTPAGRLKRWSDGQIFRAIRNGVDANGRWLTLMSYTNAGR